MPRMNRSFGGGQRSVASKLIEAQRQLASVRSQLKEATEPAHRRLDKGFGALDLTRREHYRAFLSASAAALLPLETLVEAAGISKLLGDWPARSRRTALLSDLAGLAAPVVSLPLPNREIETATIFGIVYVLEGSRLGAQVLVRYVLASKDPMVADNVRYLQHGLQEQLWQSFLVQLETVPDVSLNIHRAVEGALFAFLAFEQALNYAIEVVGKGVPRE